MGNFRKFVFSSILMAGLASSFVEPCFAQGNKSLIFSQDGKQKSKEKNKNDFQKINDLKLEEKEDELKNGLLKSLPEEKYSFLNTVGQKLASIKNLSGKQILKILVAASGLASSLVLANYILRKTNIFGIKSTKQVTQEELQNKTNEDTMGDENSEIQGVKSKSSGKNGVKDEDSAATCKETTGDENIKNQEKKSENTEKKDVKNEESNTTKNMQPGKEDNNEGVTENSGSEKINVRPLDNRKTGNTVLYCGFAAIYVFGVIIAALVESEISNEKKVTPWIALSWLDVVGQSCSKLVTEAKTAMLDN